jgi:hypothetical protein
MRDRVVYPTSCVVTNQFVLFSGKIAVVALIAVCIVATVGSSQNLNPADDRKAPPQTESVTGNVHQGTWELPPLTVMGKAPAKLREEDLIGDYAQPRWTAHRRFPGTRVYVLAKGELEFEFWTCVKAPKDGPSEVENMYELEMGLPHRFQFDLYLVNRTEGNSETFVDRNFELRYAFADWGKLWGNPTLYLEYAAVDQGPDAVETKLLFGDEITTGWHWGANIVFEGQLSGEREDEHSLTFGISKTVTDAKLAVGLETEMNFINTKDARGHFEDEILLGPSVQYRPLPNMHVDLAPLIGVSGEMNAKILLNLGWEF